MHNQNQTNEYRKGNLPDPAPLANPYVPYQAANPPLYEPNNGIIRGTIYPGLDLPFHNMVNSKELRRTPKTQMQVLAFAIQELALYLDTHPEDAEALELYRRYQTLYDELVRDYSKDCMPMTHLIPAGQNRYAWIDEPWPWEFAANKEG